MSQQAGTTSVVMAGVGGQGILLASEITAQAARLTGLQVKTNEVHGMAQRGGSVTAHIRFGQAVYSPLVSEGTARVLLALEAVEGIRYQHYLAPDGLAIVSTQQVIPVTVSSGNMVYPDPEPLLRQAFSRLHYIDALAEAQRLGEPRAANVVLLGYLAAELTLPLAAWEEAIAACVKPQVLALNLQAFKIGLSR